VARVEGFKVPAVVGTPLWAGGGVGGDGVLRCAQDDNLLFGGREIEVRNLCDEGWRGLSQALVARVEGF